MLKERTVTTISSKRQITLPASMCRALGLKEGDKLSISLVDDQLVLKPQPESYVEEYAGKMAGMYGTEREIEEYLREERASWSRETAE